jgi:nitroreductase
MDAIEALVTRRSVRRYTDQPVTEAELETVLRAAMSAPSGFGQRSTRYVVVRDPEVRAALSVVSKYSGMIANAPAAIVVCGDTRAERHPGTYFVHDAVAALENLLTAAHATGLGAVWVGVHPWPDRMDAVRAAVGLPEGVEPIASVAIGHPVAIPEAPDRFDPSFVHADRW